MKRRSFLKLLGIAPAALSATVKALAAPELAPLTGLAAWLPDPNCPPRSAYFGVDRSISPPEIDYRSTAAIDEACARILADTREAPDCILISRALADELGIDYGGSSAFFPVRYP